ncbi:MAG: response regulator [Spirochaetales bacterium]|jgi:two-component system sensor histidine kinase/response regulator|nr:response regulator [Spirochaetales bacterium]
MRNLIDEFLKSMKMRTKILVFTIVLVGTFMGLGLYQSLMIHKKTAMEQVAHFSGHILENIYSAIRFPMSIGDDKTIKEQMKDIREHIDDVQIYILDFRRNISYASEKERINSSMEKYLNGKKSCKALAEALATGKAPGESFLEMENENPFLITIKPILNESSCYHCHGASKKVLGAMVIKQHVGDVFAAIRQTRNRLVIYFATVLVCLVVFINLFFSRMVSQRIRLLGKKTGQVAAGDVTVQAIDDHQDSIGALSRNFNQMVKSIRDRMEYANSLKLGISDPFFTVDPEMKVAFINEAAVRLAGLSREEAIGMPCYEVFHTTACEQKCPIKRALETDAATVGLRMTIEDRKGHEIPVMASSALLKDSSGKVLGGFEILRNLTAEVEAERRLQDAYFREEKAKLAAEAAANAKSEFLANMSHEIRTPMNGVIAAADLALSEKMSPNAGRYLKIIQSSAYSLLGIINDILDFSKIEADKLEIENHPFLLDEVIDRTTEAIITVAAEKNIELLVDIDLETPRALTGDSLRLQQIIKNLIDNAIKFTKKGGVILVGVKALEKTSDHVTLAFSVKDTGIGIAPEYVGKLFKPFSQADTSTTRKYAGTGLGLSICKQLVELMHGDIRVESELGRGSTFHFTARFKLQAEERKRRLIPPPDIQDLKVLVVDDCPDSRTIIQNILESFGFRPESVSSGKEALDMLKKNQTMKEPFDLVIIDWRMPEMDGIEASRIIREDLKLTIPIILLTAFGREAEELEAKKAGINIFLTKPIFQSTLFNAIMDAFGKESKERMPGKEITTKASIYKKRLKGVRLLVAEDNPTNQEIAKAILERAGIIVEVVNNGEEAVEAARKGRFDVVLMDVQMPKMDGYEATAGIRNIPELKSLPIIAMTAHALKGDEEKCLKAGMDAYVSKPINQDRLFQTIWRTIKSEKGLPDDKEAETVIPEESVDTLIVATGGLPAELPGINIKDTLKALNIGADVFKRILIGFFRNNKDTTNKIYDAFKEKDSELLVQLAHSLKGSAGNIGAVDLQEAAFELEKASRKGTANPPGKNLIDNVVKALSQVLESLQALADAEKGELPDVKAETVDPAQVIPLLKQLADALELADPEEINIHFKAVKGYLDFSTLKELEAGLNDYDYDNALKSLEEIAVKLGGL